MSDRDLDHSRPLDVHRWSDYQEVDEWVDKFWHQHLAEYFPDTDGAGRKPKQTPRNMFKVLFLDRRQPSQHKGGPLVNPNNLEVLGSCSPLELQIV